MSDDRPLVLGIGDDLLPLLGSAYRRDPAETAHRLAAWDAFRSEQRARGHFVMNIMYGDEMPPTIDEWLARHISDVDQGLQAKWYTPDDWFPAVTKALAALTECRRRVRLARLSLAGHIRDEEWY